MSCQFNLGGLLTDVTYIRELLFPSDEKKGSDSWLQLCEISLSPSGDLLAIAHEKTLIILVSHWNDNDSLVNYHIASYETLSDNITSVLCLPIVTQNYTSQIDSEWTCVAVGTKTGHVLFFTEDCKLLLDENFHSEPVVSVKCQSQHSPRPDINPDIKLEEVYVQYQSTICILSGTQLFGILRNHRSQLIRGNNIFTSNDNSLITPKKWSFIDQFSVSDSVVVGLQLSNTFDHLLTASTCGGFDSKYRAMPPNNTLVLATGNKPFVGFHFAIEGGTQPMFTDVAKAIATKVRSALPTWLTGGKSSQEKEKVPSAALQPAEPMACRFGICDLRRNGVHVTLSPNRHLAAVTDILGRVSLIDIRLGITIRIFKGYRDAQCAFIQVPDEMKSRHKAKNRIATFLIIYCPKKGTVEILSVQQGTKIAVFTASRYSRLIYVTYGLMGFNTSIKSKYVCRFTCVLVDPDGTIKDIVVPFHFALPEKNSKRSRDVHLYKKLKQFIKTKTFSEEELLSECLETCKELKTAPIQVQCLEMISFGKEADADVVLQCSDFFLHKYKDIAIHESDMEVKKLVKLAENLKAISKFFEFVMKFENTNDNEVKASTSTENQTPGSNKKKKKLIEDSNMEFLIGHKELNNLQKLLDISTIRANEKKSHEVTFSSDKDINFPEFVSTFDLSNKIQISVKYESDDELLFLSSKLIFSSFIEGNRDDYEDFKLNIINSNISVKDFFKMLICYWVNRNLPININLEKEMQHLNRIVYEISKTASDEDVVVNYNEVSKFWTEVRNLLANSEKPFPALTAALICRSVSLAIEHEKDLQTVEDDSEIFEKFSDENCQWMLLIGKLEDVSLLNIILSSKPKICDKSLSSLPKLRQNPIQISLKMILEKGRGSVSELVAQWLTKTGIDPLKVVEEKSSEETEDSSEETDPLLIDFGLIRKQFPYSTNESIILTNMCWEYALAWQKNIQDFPLLNASLSCLNAVKNLHLKQGLYNLVWNTHLKIIFESTCKLINKVGKMPKEILCRQYTGLSDVQVLKFLQTCTDFLDTFLEVIQQCYNCEREILKYEPIWDEVENNDKPLAEIALQQIYINYDLVHLHYQLSLVMLMQTTFNIKFKKTVNNLFDNVMTSLFFSDFQQKVQINWHKPESTVISARTLFLSEAVVAVVETLTVNDQVNHAKWIGKILNLGRVWNLNVDSFKRLQIIRLYTLGFDSIAEELLPAVTELDVLASDLIKIAGKRLLQNMSTSKNFAEKMSAVSPALKQYLDSLGDGWCAPSSLEAIRDLALHCLHFIKTDQVEYEIVSQFFEACQSLLSVES